MKSYISHELNYYCIRPPKFYCMSVLHTRSLGGRHTCYRNLRLNPNEGNPLDIARNFKSNRKRLSLCLIFRKRKVQTQCRWKCRHNNTTYYLWDQWAKIDKHTSTRTHTYILIVNHTFIRYIAKYNHTAGWRNETAYISVR